MIAVSDQSLVPLLVHGPADVSRTSHGHWCHSSGQKVSTSNSQSSYNNPLYQRNIINILGKQRIWQYFILGRPKSAVHLKFFRQ